MTIDEYDERVRAGRSYLRTALELCMASDAVRSARDALREARLLRLLARYRQRCARLRAQLYWAEAAAAESMAQLDEHLERSAMAQDVHERADKVRCAEIDRLRALRIGTVHRECLEWLAIERGAIVQAASESDAERELPECVQAWRNYGAEHRAHTYSQWKDPASERAAYECLEWLATAPAAVVAAAGKSDAEVLRDEQLAIAEHYDGDLRGERRESDAVREEKALARARIVDGSTHVVLDRAQVEALVASWSNELRVGEQHTCARQLRAILKRHRGAAEKQDSPEGKGGDDG